MARCPYLSLEEEGASPFPFTSASHRCYVSRKGVPIGQREQERYCLSKRYKDCPLFLSHSLQPGLTEDLAPPVVEQRREAVTEPASGQRAEPLLTEQELAYESGEALVEEEPQIVVGPPSGQMEEKGEVPTEPPPVKHKVAYGLGEGVVEERPETGVAAPLEEMEEKAEVVEEAPHSTGMVASGLGEAAIEQKLKVALEPPVREKEEKSATAAEALPVQGGLPHELHDAVFEERIDGVVEIAAEQIGEKPEVAAEVTPIRGKLAYGLGERVVDEDRGAVAERPDIKMAEKAEAGVQAVAVEDAVARRLGAAVEGQKPDHPTEPPLQQTMDRLPSQEEIAAEPVGAVVEEGLGVAVRLPSRRIEKERDLRGEPLSPRKAPATRHPEAVAETRKARVQVGLLLKDADTAGTSLVSMIPKALPWVVAGGVSSTLLCVVGSILYWVLTSPPEVSMSSLALPSLWPVAVVLMSGIGLVGAVLLIGVFVLTRLAASR